MRKRSDRTYNKRNIFVVIFPNDKPGHGGDRETFKVIYFTLTMRNPWFSSLIRC